MANRIKKISLDQLPAGHYVAELLSSQEVEHGGSRRLQVTYKCACGAEKVTWAMSLRSGKVRSCGCARSRNGGKTLKHGRYSGADKSHPLCATWVQIMVRCYDVNAKEYPRYGGRGIDVCSRWRGKNGFSNFVLDMGCRPPGCTIDRIDNNKGYSLGNCRWATHAQQQRNLRSNRKLSVGGDERTISAWAEVTGVSASTIRSRIKAGIDVPHALGLA